MMAHNLHNIIFEISTNSIERKDVFMKRQLVHRIHKLLSGALPLLIMILIIPLTSQATPYVYTYTGNLFISPNGVPGHPLEAIGDHVSDTFHFVPGSNGPLPSWSIYGEPDQIGRLAFVNQRIPMSKNWAGRSMSDKTHRKVPATRLQSTKLTRNGQSTKAPLLHPSPQH
jgi:hypothetical protein